MRQTASSAALQTTKRRNTQALSVQLEVVLQARQNCPVIIPSIPIGQSSCVARKPPATRSKRARLPIVTKGSACTSTWRRTTTSQAVTVFVVCQDV